MPWKNLTADLAELFSETQTDVEGALYRAHQWRVAQRREAYALDHAARRAKAAAQARYVKTPAGRAQRAAYKQRVNDKIKAQREARPRVVIPPVGRPPELEARIQAARARLHKVQRRRKIKTLASSRLRTRTESARARQGR